MGEMAEFYLNVENGGCEDCGGLPCECASFDNEEHTVVEG